MIVGVGVDIVDVADMKRRLGRGTIEKAFSEAERAYAARRPKRRAEILAARWAAKEAFGKALGTGIPAGRPLDQIEVVAEPEKGRPMLRLGPAVADVLSPGMTIHLSLSHTPAYAVAFVVIERV